MTSWVMIIVLLGSQGHAVSGIEFNSQEACLKAAKYANDQIVKSTAPGYLDGYGKESIIFCAEK